MALAISASHDVIASEQELADLIRQIQAADRVALDTEADSLHSYREKLCLLQISAPSAFILSNVEGSRGTGSKVALPDGKPGLVASGGCVAASTSLGMTVQSVCDFIVDPLSNLDLEPLRLALEPREIVLHAADYDLRMLRRGLNFTASKIFDTVDCGAVAWDPRIQSGCAGEALLRCRASQTFAKGKLGAATAAGADAEIRGGRRALFVAACRKIRGRAGACSPPGLVPTIL